jgi:hypothetical protein
MKPPDGFWGNSHLKVFKRLADIFLLKKKYLRLLCNRKIFIKKGEFS